MLFDNILVIIIKVFPWMLFDNILVIIIKVFPWYTYSYPYMLFTVFHFDEHTWLKITGT